MQMFEYEVRSSNYNEFLGFVTASNSGQALVLAMEKWGWCVTVMTVKNDKLP